MTKYIIISIIIIFLGLIVTKNVDIVVAQVRPLNVSQTIVTSILDSNNGICLQEIQITDRELEIGEKINAYKKIQCLWKPL